MNNFSSGAMIANLINQKNDPTVETSSSVQRIAQLINNQKPIAQPVPNIADNINRQIQEIRKEESVIPAASVIKNIANRRRTLDEIMVEWRQDNPDYMIHLAQMQPFTQAERMLIQLNRTKANEYVQKRLKETPDRSPFDLKWIDELPVPVRYYMDQCLLFPKYPNLIIVL
jgi:hypothetical protein